MSVAVVLLACFNITFRLGRESVGEWDESLYATTAWEMTQSGNLIATTLDGTLDYYNSKPPLNVWLIAVAIKWFDIGLVALRVPSASAAVLTVVIFLWWARRWFGTSVSVVAGTVLATSFGYLHIHAARSGNPDSILTLLMLLVVVVLSDVPTAPWRRVWLGPLLGAVFLLKGMAVLQPMLLVGLFEALVRGARRRWLPLSVAATTTAAIVGAWALLRWQVDQWHFLRAIVGNDFLALSLTQLEGHNTGLLFYLGVLQRYQYEWLIAAVAAIGLTWRSCLQHLSVFTAQLRERQPLPIVITSWAVATLAVPTAMQTRLAWYLTPFYPLFALLVGLAIVGALSELQGSDRRRMALVVLVLVTLVGAESRSLWRLYKVTDLETSVQGLLMHHVRPHSGQRVYRDRPSRAEGFVVRAILESEFSVEHSLAARPVSARPGDLVVVGVDDAIPGLTLLARRDGYSIHVVD